MKVLVNEQQYGQLELSFAQSLVLTIAQTLQENGVDSSLLPQLTEAISSNVGALIDGCYPLSFQGKPLYPVLTYSQQEVGLEQEFMVVSSGATSDLHTKCVGRIQNEAP